ncbi:hypothetical protein [Cellulosimicrobium protaetiae]|uniref:Uncharacterized protein n=1 Tax=Cellulosimicrobium protaetiae TaxID=2587808 RepID=A0A6M5UCD5_9MICO|nr:hypothetical protein [Cellulosimicrobium protaetiae]QJW35754.1 hypothetical protein FIC82_005620 [Cellulosimicrobium protaetiae]
MTTRTPDEPSGPAVEPDDAALDRVRAADPAADATPDVAALEAAVRARVPDAFAGASATTGPPDGSPLAEQDGAPVSGPGGPAAALVDELAERRARRLRRRTPLQVAAAVAGVLVVGAGGYALGAGAVGASPAGDSAVESTALAPIQLGGAGEAGQESGFASDGATTGQPLEAGARASADMAYPGFWGGRTVFHQEGLSTQGASADAWSYDAAGVFSPETALRVAEVLGVPGEVREEYGSLVVGSTDWTGPTVSLQPDGLASVSFNDPTKDPWGCVVVTPMPADGAGSDGSSTEPGGCEESDHGAPPSGADAVERLRDLLGSLGLDAAGYEVVAEEQVADQEAPRATTVTAYEVVDGQRTGTQWSATYSGAGLASLYGGLAPRVAIGAYDVVSPADAVERLGDPRFGGGGMIAWAREGAEAVPEIAPVEPEEPTVPPTVGEGARFAWPVTDVTITDARLGLAVQYQPDGAAVLLPAYELSDAEGNVWSVVAVADAQLDFSPAG